MALSITSVPFQLSPTEEWTTAKFNQGFNPTISFTGSVATGDLASGAVTAAKLTPDAYAYAAASGTDTYTATFSPAFTAYINGLQVRVKFANANATTTPTLNANSLGAKKLRFRGDVAVRAGDIPANCILDLTYNTSLDSGSGGWEIQDALENYSAVVAQASNLVCRTNATNPNYQVDIDADELLLKDTSGVPYLASSVNLTADITASGANGLDTGVESADAWYYLWAIYNPTTATVAGLISTSATAPTMPSGYTYKALVGAVRNTSSNFIKFYQTGKRVFQAVQEVFTALTGVTTYTNQGLSTFVPPIAKTSTGSFGRSGSGGGTGGMVVAGDDNGVGECIEAGAVMGATYQNFYNGSRYEVPMMTAQTLYWKSYDTSAAYRLTVNGYTLG